MSPSPALPVHSSRYQSFRYFPSNLDVIDWLGSYFIELQYAEKAIEYFERASLMQPDQSKWQLMVAACHRRAGAYHKALNTYRQIHTTFPENIECEQQSNSAVC